VEGMPLPIRIPVASLQGCILASHPKCTESRLRWVLGAGRFERKSGLEPSSPLEQIDNQDDDGNHEQEMDQTTANVAK
jgi:hypothetical protein